MREREQEARSEKREARSEKRAPQVVAGALSRHASLANHRPRKFAGVGRCAVAMLAGVGVLRHHGWLGHGVTLYLRATATPCCGYWYARALILILIRASRARKSCLYRLRSCGSGEDVWSVIEANTKRAKGGEGRWVGHGHGTMTGVGS